MNRAAASPRSGFTLVELLVVIAIIGMLVALLLPAVQSAREAARRTQCANHLKQIGLSILTYHDARGRYPTGRAATEQWGTSWAFEVLPQMEQQTIYDAFVPTKAVSDPENAAAMRTPVAEFYCPSRRQPVADRDFDNDSQPSLVRGVAAGGDYAANSGTSTKHGLNELANGPARNIDRSEVGPIFSFSKISARQVTDGLSKTLLVGEKHMPPEPQNATDGLQHVLMGDAAFFAADSRHTIFRRSSAGFPNSRDEPYRGHFGSEHPGVAYFVFLDGHVQSLDYDLDIDILKSLSAIGDDGFVPDDIIDADD